MKLRYGLYPRFLMLAGGVLLVVLAVVGVMLHRQNTMQREIVALSQESIHALVFDRLRERGEAVAEQLADSLVNPLYYFDLDAIGVVVRNVLRQSDVSYVIVYDNNGAVIHDGSSDIATYGQAMHDPLAYEVVTARDVHVQVTGKILDVSAPIRIGDQRIGGVRIGYSLDSVNAEEATRHRRHAGADGRDQPPPRVLDPADDGGAGGHGRHREPDPAALAGAPGPAAGQRRARDRGRQLRHPGPGSPRDDEIGDLVRAFSRMGDSIVAPRSRHPPHGLHRCADRACRTGSRSARTSTSG